MKLFIALLLTTTAFADDAPQFCKVLDKHNDFTRCETTEVICYQFQSYSNCFVRNNTPSPQPSTIPTPPKQLSKTK